jgi:hypothetical protein
MCAQRTLPNTRTGPEVSEVTVGFKREKNRFLLRSGVGAHHRT